MILASDQRPIPDNYPAAQVLLAAEVVSRSSRSDDRFRRPGQDAQAGIPFYLRVELDPVHVVGYRLGAEGIYVESARAHAGEVFTLDAPFAVSFDPAVLLRSAH